jgi:dTDP-4-amino-4,6-dideoxygalactose transaminase
MSMMAGKSFAIGEGGMLVTDDPAVYERGIAFGFYERTGVATEWSDRGGALSDPELARYAGIPLGSYKHRLNQTCAAMGLVQLKHYPARIAEIQRALNRFWDLLEDVPGIVAHRPPSGSGSTMGGWYPGKGLYRAEELGGIPVARFCEAVAAEGVPGVRPGGNRPLHLHPYFHSADVFRMGQPTALAFGQRDVRQGPGSLPVTESMAERMLYVPWFKHDWPDLIEPIAAGIRKVAEHADQLAQ